MSRERSDGGEIEASKSRDLTRDPSSLSRDPKCGVPFTHSHLAEVSDLVAAPDSPPKLNPLDLSHIVPESEPLSDTESHSNVADPGVLIEEIKSLLHPNIAVEAEETEEVEDDQVELLTHGYTSDLKWALKDYRPPRYAYVKYRAPAAIREEVLQSSRVRRVISMLCKETGRTKENLAAEASNVLEEMGHEFSEGILRCAGGLIRKIFKQITTSVVVHKEGLRTLRELSSQKPLILIPSHRSYLDFIIVTWLLYSFDIKTPVIAAGQDFMFMRGVGTLLRRCGAYFIRRSFGKDKLYWAVFTEYTQTHIIHGHAPVEFFIEGTRSRTGKSLQPKFGMLTIALEPFFDSRISDLAVCPISISYEKTIEETLHVRELMGTPKPRESTTGLIKARSVLGNNYGTIHVRVGTPMSVREEALGKVDRKIRALVPRAVIPSVHPHERTFVNELAYRMLLEQQRNAVVFPCSVLAAVLLHHVQNKEWKIPVQQAEREVMWGCELLINLGTTLQWGQQLDITHLVAMLSPVVRLDGDGVLVIDKPPTSDHISSVFNQCHSLISLGRRRNEFMHAVIHVCILSVVLLRPKCRTRVYDEYCKLRNILQLEFIFLPNSADADFECSLSKLEDLKLLNLNQNLYRFINIDVRNFLVSLINPFLVSYMDSWQFCISYMPRTLEHSQSLKSLKTRIQTYLSVKYCEPYLFGELLNLNVIENSILSLAKMDVVSINKDKSSVYCTETKAFSIAIREFALTIYPFSAKL